MADQMLQSQAQTESNRTILLLKSDFHKIEKLTHSKDKIFEIKISSKSYFFSKETIILFSVSAFLYICDYHHSFDVVAQDTISENQLLTCFHELFLLFSSSEEIDISSQNVFTFQYLSEVFENHTLYFLCKEMI
jgi:hypothetical protein